VFCTCLKQISLTIIWRNSRYVGVLVVIWRSVLIALVDLLVFCIKLLLTQGHEFYWGCQNSWRDVHLIADASHCYPITTWPVSLIYVNNSHSSVKCYTCVFFTDAKKKPFCAFEIYCNTIIKYLQTFYVHVTVHRNKFVCNKTKYLHQIHKFIFFMKVYIFRTIPLSIIRSLFTVHSSMVYVIQVCRQLSNRTRILLIII